jgi:hypothetical protein
MKKLLLAGVAALSLLNTAGAQATKHRVELSDVMLGTWCYAKYSSSDTESHYSRADDHRDEPHVLAHPDCANRDTLRLQKKSYTVGSRSGSVRNYCKFKKIEVIKGSKKSTEDAATDAYLVHANCRSGWGDVQFPPWTENFQLQVIEDELVLTELRE